MRRPYQRPHAVAIGLIDGKAKNCTSVGDNRPMHSVCASLLRIRYAHNEVLEAWTWQVLVTVLEFDQLESRHGGVIGVLKVGGEYSDAELTFIKAIRPKKVRHRNQAPELTLDKQSQLSRQAPAPDAATLFRQPACRERGEHRLGLSRWEQGSLIFYALDPVRAKAQNLTEARWVRPSRWSGAFHPTALISP